MLCWSQISHESDTCRDLSVHGILGKQAIDGYWRLRFQLLNIKTQTNAHDWHCHVCPDKENSDGREQHSSRKSVISADAGVRYFNLLCIIIVVK